MAVDNISFTVNDGEVLGFLGPNGAGKSTTMNMLTGYLSSSSGSAMINGIDVLEDPIGAKKEIGYLPELPPLYLDMRVREYLNFVYDLKKCELPRESHIAEICRLVKIENVYDRVIKNLSKGYKQRVGLAQALIGNPKVLILDEPTVGLDPKQIIEIRTLIKSLGKSHTVILSSHILPEVSAVCDRIIVISRGKLVADGTAENLSKSLSTDHRLTVRIAGNERAIYGVLTAIPQVETVRCLGEKEPGAFDFTVEANEECDIRYEIFKRLSERGMPLLASRSMEMTLEDIFLKLTKEEGSEQ